MTDPKTPALHAYERSIATQRKDFDVRNPTEQEHLIALEDVYTAGIAAGSEAVRASLPKLTPVKESAFAAEKDEMEIDSATGLPKLPLDWFYRIKEFNLSTSQYTLSIEVHQPKMVASKTRKWLRTVAVQTQSTDVLGNALSVHTREAVLDAAKDALERARKSNYARHTVPERDQFIGDYPPKKLATS